MRKFSFIACGLAGFVLVGCTSQSPESESPALIVFYNDTARLTIPDTIHAGASFSIRVDTFGGGCIYGVSRAGVVVTDGLIEIHPYNQVRISEVCTDDLRILTHVAAVTIESPGTTLLRVIGEQKPFQGLGTRSGPVQLERTLVVR